MCEKFLKQINDYVDYFADFGQCNNTILVSGSLDYLSMLLENETLDLEMKKDLSELLSNYLLDVKKIYDLCDGNPKVFECMNLTSLENKFNRIQDYIIKNYEFLQDYTDFFWVCGVKNRLM